MECARVEASERSVVVEVVVVEGVAAVAWLCLICLIALKAQPVQAVVWVQVTATASSAPSLQPGYFGTGVRVARPQKLLGQGARTVGI